MRARAPDRAGTVERQGVRVGYEVYQAGEPALMLIPASPITHARSWKMIAPTLARRHTVVTTDGRGTGRSDRPHERERYAPDEVVADMLAVLEAAGVDRSVLVAHCHAVPWALRLAAEHPQHVLGLVAIDPAVALAPAHAYTRQPDRRWAEPVDAAAGWAMRNRAFWRQPDGYRRWIEFFFDQQLPEPHSTKQYEDTVGWALDTEPEAMIAEREGRAAPSATETEALSALVRCPVLAVRGADQRRADRAGRRRPPATRSRPGAGHPGDHRLRRSHHGGFYERDDMDARRLTSAPRAVPVLSDRTRARPQGCGGG